MVHLAIRGRRRRRWLSLLKTDAAAHWLRWIFGEFGLSERAFTQDEPGPVGLDEACMSTAFAQRARTRHTDIPFAHLHLDRLPPLLKHQVKRLSVHRSIRPRRRFQETPPIKLVVTHHDVRVTGEVEICEESDLVTDVSTGRARGIATQDGTGWCVQRITALIEPETVILSPQGDPGCWIGSREDSRREYSVDQPNPSTPCNSDRMGRAG